MQSIDFANEIFAQRLMYPAVYPGRNPDAPFQAKRAIVAGLGRLLKGVTVIGHPGKLDINDIVAKQTVAIPGVMIGWNRIRSDLQADGAYHAPIE